MKNKSPLFHLNLPITSGTISALVLALGLMNLPLLGQTAQAPSAPTPGSGNNGVTNTPPSGITPGSGAGGGTSTTPANGGSRTPSTSPSSPSGSNDSSSSSSSGGSR